jgi:hypothetical protein
VAIGGHWPPLAPLVPGRGQWQEVRRAPNAAPAVAFFIASLFMNGKKEPNKNPPGRHPTPITNLPLGHIKQKLTMKRWNSFIQPIHIFNGMPPR